MVDTVETAIYRLRVEGQEKLDQLKASLDGLSVSEEKVTKGTETTSQTLQNRLSRLDPLIRAQQQYTKELEAAQRYAQSGVGTEAQRSAQIELATKRYQDQIAVVNAVGDAHGRFSTQAMALQHSLRSSVEQLALGVSPAQILTQQLNHLSYAATGEGGLSGAFKEVGSTIGGFFGWVGRFAGSTAGLITGVAGIGAAALGMAGAWQSSQREIDRALIGIGRRSGATIGDINQIARANATATGLSVDQARDSALEFAKTGNIYTQNISKLVGVTRDFSIVTGQSATDAAKELAKAFSDPAAGAEVLNQKLGFLDGKTREYIVSLTNQNRVQEAQQALLQALAPSIERATQTLGFFEKAWAAVGNAASSAKNAIGAALSPATDQEKLASLTARRDEVASGTGRRGSIRSGLAAGGFYNDTTNNGLVDNQSTRPLNDFDKSQIEGAISRGNPVRVTDTEIIETLTNKASAASKQVAGLNNQIDELQKKLDAAAAKAADDRFKQFSLQADDAVKALIPEIEQIKQFEKALADIRRAQLDSNVGGKQGLGGNNDAAANIATAGLIAARETAAEKARIAAIDVNIASHERDISVSSIKTLIGLQGQRDAAAAVTGAERLGTEEVNRTVELLLSGKTLLEASSIAAAERSVTEAKINAQVQEQVHSLEQSTQLIHARQTGTEATVKAEQAYDNAIRAGASAADASNLRDATFQNARAQQIDAARQKEEQLAKAAEKSSEEAAKFAAAMKDVPDIAARIGGGKLFDTPDGGKSQFKPGGYESTTNTASGALTRARSIYGPGGWSVGTPENNAVPNIVPTPQGYEYAANKALAGDLLGKGAGNLMNAVDAVINSAGGFASSHAGQIDDTSAAEITRITDLMPDDQKSGTLQRLIQNLNNQPETIARDTLIKSLNDSLKQLTDASKANTEAINAQLDPLMSQGHQYLDQLKLGYFHAASGIDVVARGPSSGDKVPFRAMVNGGERIQITPAGGGGTANDNSRTVNVTQNITMTGDPLDRLTAKQKAQGFIAAAIRAAG